MRLLLTQDDNGDVWAVWTDFEWIARRHNIRDRVAQFKMATAVVELDHVDDHDEITLRIQRTRISPRHWRGLSTLMSQDERILR